MIVSHTVLSPKTKATTRYATNSTSLEYCDAPQLFDPSGIDAVQREFERTKHRIESGEFTASKGAAEIRALNGRLLKIRRSAALSIERVFAVSERVAERDEA